MGGFVKYVAAVVQVLVRQYDSSLQPHCPFAKFCAIPSTKEPPKNFFSKIFIRIVEKVILRVYEGSRSTK